MGFDQAFRPERSTTVTRSQGEPRNRSSGIAARVMLSPWIAREAIPWPDTMIEAAAEHSTCTAYSVTSIPRISGPWLE